MQPTPGARKRLFINRSSVFEDSVGYFKQREFDFSTPIKITFEGEPAVEGGGPSCARVLHNSNERTLVYIVNC